MKIETLAEQLFFTTVQINTAHADGSVGTGTGFLFSYQIDAEKNVQVIVTNKHVVEGARSGLLTFHIGTDPKTSPSQRFSAELTNWAAGWHGHPSPDVDIAVAGFQEIAEGLEQKYGVTVFAKWVPSLMIPTAEQMQDMDALEPVTFIGYPNGIWDRVNNLPIARTGVTASPMQVDFEGQPAFLIDASVFPGSSGSPVFVIRRGAHTMRNGDTAFGTRAYFVGVIASVYYKTEENELIALPAPTQVRHVVQNHQMIDLGYVFKARTVIETIMHAMRQSNMPVSSKAPTPTPSSPDTSPNGSARSLSNSES